MVLTGIYCKKLLQKRHIMTILCCTGITAIMHGTNFHVFCNHTIIICYIQLQQTISIYTLITLVTHSQLLLPMVAKQYTPNDSSFGPFQRLDTTDDQHN